jgi:hypothetical protein
MESLNPPLFRDLKIVSGGQTGADRAALDWALAHHLPHGGWCPKGRWAEDGPLKRRYLLQETPSSNPAQRTEWNVRDSDGTVIFSNRTTLSGGSRLTAKFARDYQKPWLHLHSHSSNPATALKKFIRHHKIKLLNIAGPRASQAPQVGEFVKMILDQAFKQRRLEKSAE